jgi:AraC family transcriptional activator of mtrCDE
MKSSDKLISLAKVRGSLDLRCQLQGDWALEQAQESLGVAPYHIVLAGECLMELADGPRLTLRAGEILHLPSGAAHVIRSLGEPVAPVIYPLVTEGAFRVMRIGGASPDLDMLCGNFHYNRASMPFAALPPVSGASR